MNAFLLMIPFFFIRFGLMQMVNKEALSRAAFFSPLQGNEKIAYLVYQLSNILIILYPLFLKIQVDHYTFLLGFTLYILGTVILAFSITAFAKPDPNGLNRKGIYRYSRNPMYVAYFLCFLGIAVITRSILLLLAVLTFQISAHWIILSEERWCLIKFKEDYAEYMRHVRRYF